MVKPWRNHPFYPEKLHNIEYVQRLNHMAPRAHLLKSFLGRKRGLVKLRNFLGHQQGLGLINPCLSFQTLFSPTRMHHVRDRIQGRVPASRVQGSVFSTNPSIQVPVPLYPMEYLAVHIFDPSLFRSSSGLASALLPSLAML